MSSSVRTPPPTVSGMKQTSAVRCTTSSRVPRFSWLAVMSRKQSSSAPGLVIEDRLLHRIAGIAQAFEIHALDDAAVLHVQAGNDADFQHHNLGSIIRPFAMAAMFIRARPVTASRRNAGGAGQDFGFQQHVQRLAQPVAVPALGLGLERGGAGKMHRRAQPLHHSVDGFAARQLSRACSSFWKWPMALRITWAGWVSDTHSRSSSRSSLGQIAAARRVAGAFAARFGFVAHHGADIFQRHLLLAVHVEQQLFNLAPRHAAVRAQPRHRILQRVGRDGEAFGAQRVAHHIAQIAHRVRIALNRGRALVAVEQLAQGAGLGQIARLDHHQRVALGIVQKGFQQLRQIVAGAAHPHHPPPAHHGNGGGLVRQPRRIGQQAWLR